MSEWHLRDPKTWERLGPELAGNTHDSYQTQMEGQNVRKRTSSGAKVISWIDDDVTGKKEDGTTERRSWLKGQSRIKGKIQVSKFYGNR